MNLSELLTLTDQVPLLSDCDEIAAVLEWLSGCIDTEVFMQQLGKLLELNAATKSVLIFRLLPAFDTRAMELGVDIQGLASQLKDVALMVSEFANDCNTDVFDEFGEFVEHLAVAYFRKPSVAVPIMQRMLLSRQGNVFTRTHTRFVHLCLQERKFLSGWSIAKHCIQGVCKSKSIYVKDILLYFFYAGLIATRLEHFSAAIDLYDNCVTLPASVPSKIMVESMKKRILVSLIQNGRLVPFKNYTDPVILREIKRHIPLYMEFVDAWNGGSGMVPQLLSIVDKYDRLIREDQNMGLFKKCLRSARDKEIVYYAEIFSSISVAELGNMCGLQGVDETFLRIEHLITSGKLNASVDETHKFISFLPFKQKVVDDRAILSTIGRIAILRAQF